MESNQKQLSSIANTQCSIINEDPNQTISDKDNEEEVNVESIKHTKPLPNPKVSKQHGRWSKQEQLLFLAHLPSSKSNFKLLSKSLPKRSISQIKIHAYQFIQMCQKEFSVSKTKQQNKIILNRICRSYGLQPTDDYLIQLEAFILDPSYDFTNNYKSKRHSLKSCQLKQREVSHNKNKSRKVKPKPAIFTIAKENRNTKVINYVTINVLANSNININGKAIVHNPFNINFDNDIVNSESKDMENDNGNNNDNNNNNDMGNDYNNNDHNNRHIGICNLDNSCYKSDANINDNNDEIDQSYHESGNNNNNMNNSNSSVLDFEFFDC